MQEREKRTEKNSPVGVLQQKQKETAREVAARQAAPAATPRVSSENMRREVPAQQSPNTNNLRAKRQEPPKPAQAATRVAMQEKPAGRRANATRK